MPSAKEFGQRLFFSELMQRFIRDYIAKYFYHFFLDKIHIFSKWSTEMLVEVQPMAELGECMEAIN